LRIGKPHTTKYLKERKSVSFPCKNKRKEGWEKLLNSPGVDRASGDEMSQSVSVRGAGVGVFRERVPRLKGGGGTIKR